MPAPGQQEHPSGLHERVDVMTGSRVVAALAGLGAGSRSRGPSPPHIECTQDCTAVTRTRDVARPPCPMTPLAEGGAQRQKVR